MCKVRLIGPKGMMKKTIGTLEAYGGAEIKKISSEKIESAKPLEGHSANVEKQLKIEALIGSLEPKDSTERFDSKSATDYLKSKDYMQTESEITGIFSEMEALNTELESLKERKNSLAPFSGLDIDLGMMRHPKSVTLLAGTVQTTKRQQVENALAKVLQVKWAMHSLSGTTLICVVAVKAGSESELEDAAKAGFDRVQIPEMSAKPAAEIRKIESKTAETEKRKASLKKRLSAISKQSFSRLAAAKEYLEIETSKSSAATSFGSTQHSFIVEAYLPEKKFTEFGSFVRNEFAEKIEVIKISSSELEHRHEETPTLLEHHGQLAPFEWINKYMSVPRSNELDPTLIFLVFFPLFYAMMVGDFIYGIASFLLARFIVKKVSGDNILKPVGIIWMWSAIPTIIFGIIYDEFAGMPHTELLHKFFGLENVVLYSGIERLHNVQLLLTVTILLGVVIVCTGFLLGFINATRHADKKHALAKIGWFGVVASGTVLISGGMFGAFPSLAVNAAAITIAASFIAVIRAEGPVGLIELPSVVGNVMSFSRILAVGLVGTLIALILNDLMFPSLDKGLLIIIVLLIYIAGHLFNVGLAMFESFIQGARLNFVEMYSKFYEGGGREFSPFRLKRKYLRD